MSVHRESGQAVSRPIMIFGIVAGVLAIGLLAYRLLSAGEPAPEPLAPAPGGVAAPPGILPAPSPTPAPIEAEVFEIFEGRDPFRPLIVEGQAVAPNGSPVPGSPAPTGGGGGQGTPAPTARPQRTGVQVEVMSVAEDGSSATVRVGSRVHENARAGQTLSSGVRVVSIDGRCVNFSRDGDSFRLCEGEFTTK